MSQEMKDNGSHEIWSLYCGLDPAQETKLMAPSYKEEIYYCDVSFPLNVKSNMSSNIVHTLKVS